MKKFIFYLISIGALLVSSCDKNDNNKSGSGGVLNINGKNFEVTTLVGTYGGWQDKFGDFTVTVLEERNEGYWAEEYTFFFKSYTPPKVGDDFATMNLRLDPPIYVGDDLTYQSGSAIMIKRDQKGSEMTIKFENLEMRKGSVSFVFNGKAVVPFDFYPDL